jgi:phosphatidate cytidylyltransferase
MLERVISGIVMAIGALAILLYSPWWAFALLVALFAMIGTDEYQRMFRPDRSFAQRLPLSCLVLLLAFQPVLEKYGFCFGTCESTTKMDFSWILPFVFLVLAFGTLKNPLPVEESPKRLSIDLLGVFYLGATLPSLMSLRLLEDASGSHQFGWVLLCMCVTFGGDTGGYFAGKFLGKHPLAPNLSPKKTIEGYIGGLFLGSAGAFAAKTYFPACSHLTVIDCVVLGIVGVSIGVAGDLFESLFKRATGVKDSGTLIPGHGGVLDRVDALLFVSPFVYYYLELFVI